MKRFFNLNKSQKGFTLIELLIVIAVLGILAAVAIPSVINYVKIGNVAAANSELASVSMAATTVAAEKGGSLTAFGVTPTNVITSLKGLVAGTIKGSYWITTDGSVDTTTVAATDGTVVGHPIYTGLTWDATTKQFIR